MASAFGTNFTNRNKRRMEMVGRWQAPNVRNIKMEMKQLTRQSDGRYENSWSMVNCNFIYFDYISIPCPLHESKEMPILHTVRL